MRGPTPRRRRFLEPLALVAFLGLVLLPARAQDPPDPLAERLVGRKCLVSHYIGSYRSPLGSPVDRRAITTIVDRGSVRYIEGSRLQLTLEGGTEVSAEELAHLDRRLDDRRDLQGFGPGEVVVVSSVKRKEQKVEIEVTGAREGKRRGRIVLRFPRGVPANPEVLGGVWRLLLPKPPYPDEKEELRAILSTVHRLELSRLAEWMGRSREETVRRVAEASLELGTLSGQERDALLACYEQSYLSLSDRSQIALVDLAVSDGPEGRVLEAVAWPHLPLLGDWESEIQRAKAAFGWSTTKLAKNLGRKCEVPEVTELLVTIEYRYRDRAGWGTDRLTSRIPAPVARAYAEIKIGTREMAGRSEHRLNDLPLSLGEW